VIDQKSNIKILRRESYLILLVIILVLLIFRNHFSTGTGKDIHKDQSNTEQTLSQNLAVHSTGIQIIVFSRSHINSKGDLWDQAIRKDSYADNIINTLHITVCANIFNELKGYSLPVFRFHLFNSESKDYPFLS
jgi:hypothetical protein